MQRADDILAQLVQRNFVEPAGSREFNAALTAISGVEHSARQLYEVVLGLSNQETADELVGRPGGPRDAAESSDRGRGIPDDQWGV